MKISTVLSACLVAGVALATLPGAPNAQPASNSARKAYKAPRNVDGRADISGVWTNGTVTTLERPPQYGERLVMTAEELAKIEGDTAARNARLNAPTPVDAKISELNECQSGSQGAACGYNAGWTDPGSTVMRVNGEPRTSFITFPASGRVPAPIRPAAAGGRGGGRGAPAALPPGGRGRAGADDDEGGEGSTAPQRPGQNDNPEGRSLGERCIMSFGQSSGPIMMDQLYNNTYRFQQTKDHVAIWVEMVHDVRIVRLNAKHRTDGVRPYMGDSIGWWDGDTLVVETINYHPRQNLRGASPNVKVTEKFTRVAPDRLLYQFKVEDPETWAQPWGGEYEFGAVNGDIYEYACHEGNYGLENILAGARAEEAAAAGRTADLRPVAR